MAKNVRLIVLLAGLFGAAPGHAEEESPYTRFSQLKQLGGTWRNADDKGRKLTVTFKAIANGSALVEAWQGASGKETVTVYHMDGGRLLATHYCGQGNQPRLKLVSPPSEGIMRFDLVDITDLDPAESHQHGFTVEILGSGQLRKTETYLTEDRQETEEIIFNRVTN